MSPNYLYFSTLPRLQNRRWKHFVFSIGAHPEWGSGVQAKPFEFPTDYDNLS